MPAVSSSAVAAPPATRGRAGPPPDVLSAAGDRSSVSVSPADELAAGEGESGAGDAGVRLGGEVANLVDPEVSLVLLPVEALPVLPEVAVLRVDFEAEPPAGNTTSEHE